MGYKKSAAWCSMMLCVGLVGCGGSGGSEGENINEDDFVLDAVQSRTLAALDIQAIQPDQLVMLVNDVMPKTAVTGWAEITTALGWLDMYQAEGSALELPINIETSADDTCERYETESETTYFARARCESALWEMKILSANDNELDIQSRLEILLEDDVVKEHVSISFKNGQPSSTDIAVAYDVHVTQLTKGKQVEYAHIISSFVLEKALFSGQNVSAFGLPQSFSSNYMSDYYPFDIRIDVNLDASQLGSFPDEVNLGPVHFQLETLSRSANAIATEAGSAKMIRVSSEKGQLCLIAPYSSDGTLGYTAVKFDENCDGISESQSMVGIGSGSAN